MRRVVAHIFKPFSIPNKFERKKVLLLSLTYLCMVFGYTIIYDLKNSIFISVVGRTYQPYAKIGVLFVLVPGILFYSMLVDRLRRYQLLYFYSLFYSLIGILCIYFIGHPTIGLANTISSPGRLFGWIFFFFAESYSPFMVSTFWALSNSIIDPESAKENYGFIVAGSKVGGVLSAGLSWFLLTMRNAAGHQFLSDEANHQLLLLGFSLSILFVPLVIYWLRKSVPESQLHGYQAVYKREQEQEKQKDEEQKSLENLPWIYRAVLSIKKFLWSISSGFFMIVTRPYILGIFSMVFFYEIINTILGYQRLAVAEKFSTSVTSLSSFFYSQMFAMHLLGLIISLFGTRALLHWLGEARCLVLLPLASASLLGYLWWSYTPLAITIAYVVSKSINYGFAYPVREALYIPTLKDVKFKSKSWIDAFGQKISRTTGSFYNLISERVAPWLAVPLQGTFFVIIIVSWITAALFLGRKYTKTIKNNEVIS